MTRWLGRWSRVRDVWRRSRLDRDIDDELRFHIEEESGSRPAGGADARPGAPRSGGEPGGRTAGDARTDPRRAGRYGAGRVHARRSPRGQVPGAESGIRGSGPGDAGRRHRRGGRRLQRHRRVAVQAAALSRRGPPGGRVRRRARAAHRAGGVDAIPRLPCVAEGRTVVRLRFGGVLSRCHLPHGDRRDVDRWHARDPRVLRHVRHAAAARPRADAGRRGRPGRGGHQPWLLATASAGPRTWLGRR